MIAMKFNRSLVAVLFSVLVLIGLEFLLGFLVWPEPSMLTDPFFRYSANYPPFVPEKLEDGSLLLRTSPNLTRSIHLQGISPVKKPEVFRVVCAGGSTVNGGELKVGFPFQLSSLVSGTESGNMVEVVNAGGLNYDSTQLRWMAPFLLDLKPDLLVLYSGHNEFLNRRVFAGVWASSRRMALLRRALDRLNLVKTIRYLAGQTVRRSDRRKDGPLPRDDFQEQVSRLFSRVFTAEERRQVIDRFQANIEEIVTMASDKSVPVILCVPASNQAHQPFITSYSNAVSSKQERKLNRLIKYAQLAMVDENWIEAVEHLRAVLEIDPKFALGHFQMAECLRLLGEASPAAKQYRLALETDQAPVRSGNDIQETVRKIASRYRCLLFDTPVFLKNIAGHFPGRRGLFVDHCHFTEKGNALLAGALAGLVRGHPAWHDYRRVRTGGDGNSTGREWERTAFARGRRDYDAVILGSSVLKAVSVPDSEKVSSKAGGTPRSRAAALIHLSKNDLESENGRVFQERLEALTYSALLPPVVLSFRDAHPSAIRFLIDLLYNHRCRYEALQALRVLTAKDYGFENFSGPLGVLECVKQWQGWWKQNEVTFSQKDRDDYRRERNTTAGEWIKSSSVSLRAAGAAILSLEGDDGLPEEFHPSVFR